MYKEAPPAVCHLHSRRSMSACKQTAGCFVSVQYSVWRTAATVGQQLLDLRYVTTSRDDVTTSRDAGRWMTQRQRVLYALLTVGAAWIDNRLDDFVALTRHISAATHVCWSHFSSLCFMHRQYTLAIFYTSK